MGNCCKQKKNITQKETKSTYIKIELPDSCVQALYSAEKPVADLLDQLEKGTEGHSLFKGAEEILDFTATLRQLGIVPEDVLRLVKQPKEEVEDSESLEIIAEEETTNRNLVGSVQPNFGTKMVLRREEAQPSALWKTAVSPTNNRHLAPADLSSFTNNTVDLSLKERQMPREFQVPFKINGVVDSDDSYLLEEEIQKVKWAHPNDSFKDLHGPYSILKRF